MGRILLAMLVGGGVLVFLGIQEMRLSKAAKLEPQTITAADLIKSGPGDNAHVLMKDFMLCGNAYVYQAKKGGGAWNNVWIPAVPLGGEYHQKLLSMLKPDGTLDGTPPAPTDIRLIIKSSKTPNEQSVEALANQDTLQGLIVNKIESLGGEQKKILRESYPGVDFANVLILEHDRKPATAGKSFGFIGGGALLSCMGVLGFVKTRKA
jgi:hypothetical protein